MNKWAITTLIAGIFFSCGSAPEAINKDNLTGLWFGGALMLDTDEYQPLPLIFHFTTDDSLVLRDYSRNIIKSIYYRFSTDSLLIGNEAIGRSECHIEGNQLFWKKMYPQHFLRPAKVKTAPKEEIKARLLKYIWRNGGEKLVFNEDGTFWQGSGEGDDYFTYCYQLDVFAGTTFLIKKGNHLSCDNNHIQFLEQIVGIDDKKLEVLRWQDNGFKSVTYTSDQRPPAKFSPATFQPCNKYLYVNNPGHRYYAWGTVYNGGLYNINKIVKSHYTPPAEVKESGLIRMRFIVNCEGKAGAFEMLELDNDYKLKKFDAKISRQIFEITEMLQDWKAGKTNQGQQVDTYRILTFRIKDGQITDIFP